MIKVSNIRWPHAPFKRLPSLLDHLNNKFRSLELVTKMTLSPDKTELIFNDVEKNFTFLSGRDNFIRLRTDDPRREKKKRDYLISRRPTKDQYIGFFTELQKAFDDLGLLADIEMTAHKFGSSCLRKGAESFDSFPKLKSYPTV